MYQPLNYIAIKVLPPLLTFGLSISGCGNENFESDIARPTNNDFSYTVVVGDSIGAASQAQNAYPNYLLVPNTIDNQSKAATRLTGEIAATFADNLNMSPLADSVIIQGGINDIRQWDEATLNLNDQLLLMTQAIEAMTAEAISRSLLVILVNITPFEGDLLWSPDRQQLTEDFNAWLASYATQTASIYINAYNVLLDQSGSTQGIDISLGGPLHPNAAGAIALGTAIDNEILAFKSLKGSF